MLVQMLRVLNHVFTKSQIDIICDQVVPIVDIDRVGEAFIFSIIQCHRAIEPL